MIAKWTTLAAQTSTAPPVFENEQPQGASIMDGTFDLSDFLNDNSEDLENLLDTMLPAEIVANESLLDTTPPAGIVANDSLVLTRKWLAANAARIDDDDEFDCSEDSVIVEEKDNFANECLLDTTPPTCIVANDSVVLTRRRLAANAARTDDDDEFDCPEDSVIIEENGSFDLSQELATPAERLMDVSLTSLMDVEIDYSLEFPTGALGRAPHIFVAKYKRDMKRKAAAEEALRKEAEKKNAIPSLMVTSPSDGDLCIDNAVDVEFEIQDIMDRSFKEHLLDGSWHNWIMRFNFETVLLELAESEAASYDVDETY